VVFVDLPKPGATLEKKGVFRDDRSREGGVGALQPLAGTVVEVNGAIEKDPAVVNRDPMAPAG